jgi:hypothetical protein
VADWRQIKARIRKAKASSEPAARLENLFEKTRDGMVAFELAGLAEQAGQPAEAVRWYTTAAERFRRDEWKKKAEEALQRLGAEVPSSPAEPQPFLEPPLFPEPAYPLEESLAPPPVPANESPGADPGASTDAAAPAARRGRRRRRGGRRHARGGRERPAAPAGAATRTSGIPAPRLSEAEIQPAPEAEPEPAAEPVRLTPAWATYARTGEPALASRLAKLEARLRRMLACAPHGLDQAEQAPVGPGVYLLSDSDLQSIYYVEACKTLRGALAQLARGRVRTASREGRSLRARLAEHLEIGETRVSRYLKESCVVRWLQLDEDAGAVAHFAIAVLTPVLNEVEPD